MQIKAHQRPDGRWEAKGIDPDTGRRRSCYSRISAEDAEAKALKSYAPRSPIDRTLYGYYATAYLPTIARRSQNWKEQVGWAMDRHVLPAFGHVDLDALTRTDLQRFFNRLTSKLSSSSAAKVKIVLSGVLNLAEDDGYIPRNPCARVRLPVAPEPEKIALTFEELKALLDACHDRIRPFVLLCGFAGLRAGEALGVSRRHVRGGMLHVRQQVLQTSGGASLTETLKTPQSRGDLPIPEAMERMILQCKQVSHVFVCSNTKGGYILPNNASRDMEEAVKSAGIRRVTPHELRHTFISLLENELECPPAVAAALARKKHKGVTAGYSHAHMTQMKKWMNRYWETAMAADVSRFAKEA